MSQSEKTVSAIMAEIREFRDERDWAQFHTPRNLAAALSVEAAEIQQELLWMDDSEVADFLASDGKDNLAHEIADVLSGGNLSRIARNTRRKSRGGRATKYNRLEPMGENFYGRAI